MTGELVKLSKKDFTSNQDVRWCPGCGDYSILATVQRMLPDLGIPKENHVFVSGIGCASRFPYYMNTYGFHTIHGRAPAVASGLKISNPDLTVWVISGDGDALSIGGNHLLHALRRNIDINILMFNNKIYGLTKGQYSPTSEQGKRTKSTPAGSLDQPLNPITFALGAGASFVARGLDVDSKGLTETLRRAVAHKGTSFVEIFQNCNVFNDGAHAHMSERSLRKERQVILQNGEPMVFGNEGESAIALDGLKPKTVTSLSDAISYDETDGTLAHIVSQLDYPEFPVPMGVFYAKERPSYETSVAEQIKSASGKASINDLVAGKDTWTVA